MGKNRNWIWYFVVLGILTVLATAVLVAYNLGQQLKPEQLETAQRLWREKGPRNYHLVYTVKRNDAEPDRYEVWVSDGRATRVLVNGLEDTRHDYYGMERLFG